MGGGASDGQPIFGTPSTSPASSNNLKSTKTIGGIALMVAVAAYTAGKMIPGEPSYPVMAVILFTLFGSVVTVIASVLAYAINRYQDHVYAKALKASH